MSFESFSYGGETIGGASPTRNTSILDHYIFLTNQDDCEFVARFVVRITPSGNATTDSNALATACQAVEAALRKRYQKLTVDWGASNQETFDPDVNALTFPSTGFDQEPHLEKVRDFPNTNTARAYEFRVRLGQPPNYTDAFGAAAGRRQVDVTEHYDTDNRLYVVMTGEWTQVPTKLARDQFLAQLDGVSGYAAYRLSKINASDPAATGSTWALVQRDETDPNALSVLRFTRRYEKHLFGRRGSTKEIFYGESGQRLITIRGTYLRTITGTGGSFGNVYGTAAGSLANFLDATNGGQAFAVTTLAALTPGEGGALTVGQDCELLREPFVTTNEQDDRTEYTLVYRELIQKQSTAAGSFLDDPNIVGDTMVFGASFNESNDSPEPKPAATFGAPANAAAGSLGSPQPGNPYTGTVSKVASPAQATNPGATSSNGSGAGSTPATKPVDLYVRYEAWFKKSVTDLYGYWRANVLPLLLSTLEDEFGYAGAELVEMKETSDQTASKVTADLHIRAYQGDVILFLFTLGLFNDLGVRVDPAFTGTPHEYLVQQALPKSTMSRRFEVVFRTGSGFSLDKFRTKPALQGWVLLNDAKPASVTRVLGIPNQGVPQVSLTYDGLEENLVWVARNVATPGSQQGSNKTVTFSGLGQNPVPAAQATGQG